VASDSSKYSRTSIPASEKLHIFFIAKTGGIIDVDYENLINSFILSAG
jgi:hypothetical protein